MHAVDIARWQFAITTVYHFFFVPVTIGLSAIVACFETAWLRHRNPEMLRLTKFFGKLFTINFALGLVTGIVQEFQFGMNWSDYSRFVGDIFGAPLAIEALLAFFLESTFLGLWIFGWDRLPPKLHAACMWLVAVGTLLSAYFILAANSWMQHPVGATLDPETGRAEMTEIGAVLTNSTLLCAFPHTIAASFLTAGTFIAGIGAWWMVRCMRRDDEPTARVYRPAVLLGVVTMLVSGMAVIGTGDWQGKLLVDEQPMKMASAEAICRDEDGAALSLLSVGGLSNSCKDVTNLITIPGLASFLGKGSFDARLPGVDDLQNQYEDLYGEGIDYRPGIVTTYWSFRLMIGLGAGSAALAIVALWLLRRRRVVGSPWFARLGLLAIPTPFLACSLGWVFTEMGRQPWIVAPNPGPDGVDGVWMLAARGVSTSVGPAMVLTSLIAFTTLYGVLAVVWFRLMRRYAAEGISTSEPAPGPHTPGTSDDDEQGDRPLSFAY
jgi:cytochrome bd ubiquinol oxidase subunit I